MSSLYSGSRSTRAVPPSIPFPPLCPRSGRGSDLRPECLSAHHHPSWMARTPCNRFPVSGASTQQTSLPQGHDPWRGLRPDSAIKTLPSRSGASSKKPGTSCLTQKLPPRFSHDPICRFQNPEKCPFLINPFTGGDKNSEISLTTTSSSTGVSRISSR